MAAVPKRSEQRRRRNKPAVPVTKGRARGSTVPEPKPEWHVIARDWFVSLGRSGQSAFYEPSDWAQAFFVAEIMSRALDQGQRPSATLIAQVFAGATELLTTEGARRRMRLELERVEVAEPASVRLMEDYRSAASD